MGRLCPIVVLEGGLGNQLFQFAYALSLRSASVVLDDRQKVTWGEPLKTVLKPAAWRPVRQAELLRALACPRLPFGQRTAVRKWNGIVGAMVERRQFRAANEQDEPEFLRTSGPVLLRGYFQRAEYANSVRSELLQCLIPRVLKPHPAVNGDGTHAAISFRLGFDYESFGMVLPSDYYRRAMQELSKDSSTIHVCADDSERARMLIRSFDTTATIVEHFEEDSIEQLRVLATARQLAISNSTFAWWGAWIGDDAGSGRRVLSPDRWLAGDDSIPSAHWFRIPTGL